MLIRLVLLPLSLSSFLSFSLSSSSPTNQGRSSKAIEDLQVPGVLVRPNPAETRIGDTAILSVIEAYCNTARFKAFIRT